MSQKNFVSHGDAETVLTEFADSIKSKETKHFTGTTAEWETLTVEQKTAFEKADITDDESAIGEYIKTVNLSQSFTVGANDINDQIAIDLSGVPTGYTPVGVVQINYTQTNRSKLGLMYYDILGSNLRIATRNFSTIEITNTVVATVLCVKGV